MHAISDGSKPASSNVRGAEYPRVYPDGRVTFRVYAPQAHKVQIEPIMGQIESNGYNGLGKAPYDMIKDEEGFWTVTTPPVVPGWHAYWLVVDGVRVCDPSSQTYPGMNGRVSGVEVPEPGIDFYDVKDVPHGEVRMRWYFSRVLGQWRRALIYTPPDYDINLNQRYPVLYLRHGGGEDETAWIRQGRANFILDNLIAEGKARPMLIVMDSNYAYRPGQPFQQPGQPPPQEIYEITIKELIPLIDTTYRTIPDREHRAMAGLSMGAVQTLYIGLANPDTYSHLGIFSRRPMSPDEFNRVFDGVLTNPVTFNKKMRLFWWGAGTAEEGIYRAAKADLATLEKAGIKYVFVEFPGLAHEWQTWRKSLYDFAQRLFR